MFTIIQLYPRKSEVNFIHNERKRIQGKCSSKAPKHIGRTAYTKRSALRAITETLNLPTQNGPYISEWLNHRITNIFQKENIPVHSAYRSHRQALSIPQLHKACMQQGQVPHFQPQIVCTKLKKCCLPDHV